MHEALFYASDENKSTTCLLCPHECIIAYDKTGSCKVRQNSNGKLYSLNYGRPISINIDPIEKKPLYHFLPKSDILSVGVSGCNMGCMFCQNNSISQKFIPSQIVTAESVCNEAIKNNCPSIAYTYTEPTVWYEYMFDIAKLAKVKNLKNVIVTNGLINKNPLELILPYIDAMNIDIKAFDSHKYKLLKGNFETVKDTIISAYEKGCHVEITFLSVTDFNCDDNELNDIVSFISNISENIPLHISRYFPAYKYDKPATSTDLLKKFYDKASEKLNYVYIGNASIEKTANTYCPNCKSLLIERNGYSVTTNLNSSRCTLCNQELPFIF